MATTSALDTRLCQILERMGCLDAGQTAEALDVQKLREKRVGQVLLDLGYVEEDDLLRALSEQYGFEFRADMAEGAESSLVSKAPVAFIKQYGMAPVREADGVFEVALSDPAHLPALNDLRLVLGGPVKPVLCREADIQRIIDGYFEEHGETASEMAESIVMSGDEDEIYDADALDTNRDLLDLANEAPIIKLINLMISGAVKERASDIHVEPYERDVMVRYRIDGVLYEKFNVPKSQHAAVVSRIKIMARLNIAEHRLPQDGRIKIRLGGKEIDIRVSVIPIQHGERVVMRILEKSSFLLSLSDLGMGGRDYDTFGKIISNSHGIILVTGPTGSGKSTTLYAALQRVLSPDINVITVEDPVEYQMQGVGQIEVRPKIGLTFASALRSILRQDPDVILVGEIRDLETAEMAVHASLTGHMVFSTLHTNDSAGAVTRLVNMGIEPFLVTSSTIAIIAQRLVRRLCDGCKTSLDPDPESLAELGVNPEDYAGRKVYHGEGCPECQERGYFGRTGIFEMMPMTPMIQDLTLRGQDSNAIKREARRSGLRTLRDDGTRLVFEGATTVEEVLRVTRDDFLGELPE